MTTATTTTARIAELDAIILAADVKIAQAQLKIAQFTEVCATPAPTPYYVKARREIMASLKAHLADCRAHRRDAIAKRKELVTRLREFGF